MWQQQSEVDWRRSAAPVGIERKKERRKVEKNLFFPSVEKIDFEGESEAFVRENFQWFMLSELIFIMIKTCFRFPSNFLGKKQPIIIDANHNDNRALFAKLGRDTFVIV